MELKKQIGLKEGTALTIGSIVGSGLLLLPGLAYSLAGADSLIGWIVMGILSLPFIYIFANLTSLYPSAGGIANFVKKANGEKWTKSATYVLAGTWPIALPILALIAANYISYLFPLSKFQITLVAFLILSGATIINLLGSQIGGKIQNFTTVFIVLFLFLIIFMGIPKLSLTSEKFAFSFEIENIWKSMALIFWAFLGWENMSFTSEEFKNPHRDFPLSLILGYIVIIFLYMGISLNVVEFLNPNDPVTVKAPIAKLFHVLGGKSVGILAGLTSILLITVNANAWVWGASRSIFAGGREGILPSYLGKVHRKNGTPYASLLTLLGCWGLILIIQHFFDLSFNSLIMVANQNFMVLYLFSIVAFIKLNRTMVNKVIGIISLVTTFIFMKVYGLILLYPISLIILPFIVSYLRKNNR
ncbi:MAG: amino acid permease [Nitrospirae bacterium]|nr:amino acid permease [Nitrospirota bacterium]